MNQILRALLLAGALFLASCEEEPEEECGRYLGQKCCEGGDHGVCDDAQGTCYDGVCQCCHGWNMGLADCTVDPSGPVWGCMVAEEFWAQAPL